jgi:hypothetical protein
MWHLTPGGWVRGDEHTDSGNEHPTPPPLDRVQTVRVGVSMDGKFKFRGYSLVEWTVEDLALVKRLRRKFGPPPAPPTGSARRPRRRRST